MERLPFRVAIKAGFTSFEVHGTDLPAFVQDGGDDVATDPQPAPALRLLRLRLRRDPSGRPVFAPEMLVEQSKSQPGLFVLRCECEAPCDDPPPSPANRAVWLDGAMGPPEPSVGAEDWWEDLGSTLERSMSTLLGSELEERIIAILLAGAEGECFRLPGFADGRLGDANPGVLRAWCEGPGGDRPMPTAAERARCAPTGFRDSVADRDAMDFESLLADLLAARVGDLAGRVRAADRRGRPVGATIGDCFSSQAFQDGYLRSGADGWLRLVKDPRISFLASAPLRESSSGRRVGAPVPTPTAGLAAAGVPYIHVAPPSPVEARSAVAAALSGGHGLLGISAAEAAEARELVCRAWAMTARPTPNAPIAFVFDGDSHRHVKREAGQFAVLLEDCWRKVASLGAPAECIELAHLTPVAGRRLLVLPNLFHLDASKRARIAAAVADPAVSLLWFTAPGFSNETGVAFEKARGVTGFLVTKPVGDVEAWVCGLGLLEGESWGHRGFRAHLPHLEEDPAQEVVGRFVESGRVALAIRRRPGGGWSAYSSIPGLSRRALAAVAKRLGVPFVAQGASIVVDRGPLRLVHALEDGVRVAADSGTVLNQGSTLVGLDGGELTPWPPSPATSELRR